MSLLCKYIFGILVTKLGLNPHGFNLGADNQSCSQKPMIGAQTSCFLMPAQKAEACVVCVLREATGWFSQRNRRDRLREGFCKKNPFRLSTRKGYADNGGCRCPRVESHTKTSCGFSLRVSSMQPRPQVPMERNDRRSQVNSSGVRTGRWLSSLPNAFLERKNIGSVSAGDFTRTQALGP